LNTPSQYGAQSLGQIELRGKELKLALMGIKKRNPEESDDILKKAS